jgi:anti-anti-sigma regulatory factor
MEYKKQYWDDIFSVQIKLKRATYLEAEGLSQVLNWELEKEFKKIIIDLSECIYIDPVFLGVLISSLKKLVILGGNLKIVLPQNYYNLGNNIVKSLHIFDTYKSHQDAVESYKKVFVTPQNEEKYLEEVPETRVSFSV